MTTAIVTCKRKSGPTNGFLVGEDEGHAYVLDYFVWAVHTKPIPMEEWKRDWVRTTLPPDKIEKMFESLKQSAIVVGATPEGMAKLAELIPVTKEEQRFALDKGYQTLQRHKTAADAERHADEQKLRKLAGAPLASMYKKEIALLEARLGKTAQQVETVPVAEEVGTAEVATETVKPKRQPKAKTDPTAEKVRKLATEATEELAEAEKRGVNPAKAMKRPAPGKTEGFNPTKLKGVDGKYKSASAMFKGLILEAKLSDDKIFQAVQKQFGLSDDKRSYVQWNRNWLKKEGIIQ
jgi:hypothetical protein